MYTAATIAIRIIDSGIGIFRKVKEACGLAEEREAILELAKGKLTTAPAQHTGYGIFVTSRMVDVFAIRSGNLLFTHIRPDDDWLIEHDQAPIKGTTVEFLVSTNSERKPSDVYNQFFPEDDENGGDMFSKTHVPIRLAQYGAEKLVSRSQAKRVLARFEKFSEVMVDFRGVEFVSQAFADEIFRVFKLSHPQVKIAYTNASQQIKRVVNLALGIARSSRQRKLFD